MFPSLLYILHIFTTQSLNLNYTELKIGSRKIKKTNKGFEKKVEKKIEEKKYFAF
jgi:hypothetical protein